MVRIKRLELLCLAAPDPKSGVSTNFTISASDNAEYNIKIEINQAKNAIIKIKISNKKSAELLCPADF